MLTALATIYEPNRHAEQRRLRPKSAQDNRGRVPWSENSRGRGKTGHLYVVVQSLVTRQTSSPGRAPSQQQSFVRRANSQPKQRRLLETRQRADGRCLE